MGYRVILADTDTRIERGGDLSFASARRQALAYLGERLRRRRDSSPQRLANLRLALLRITAQRREGAAGGETGAR